MGAPKSQKETYTDIPSSLMIYPIPYPSAATGPNPNRRSAGFPQFDVDRIDVLSSAQPGSVKIAGIAALLQPPPLGALPLPLLALLPLSLVVGEGGAWSGEGSSVPSCISRCRRQYSA